MNEFKVGWKGLNGKKENCEIIYDLAPNSSDANQDRFVVINLDKNASYCVYYNGKYGGDYSHHLDLMPTVRTVYIYIYDTRTDADVIADPTRICCRKVELTPGRYDD